MKKKILTLLSFLIILAPILYTPINAVAVSRQNTVARGISNEPSSVLQNTTVQDQIKNDLSKSTVNPAESFDGSMSGDFSLQARKSTVNSGESAIFNLDLKVTGSDTIYHNVVMSVEVSDIARLNNTADDLTVMGVKPVIIGNVIKWSFPEIKGGVTVDKYIRLQTRIGEPNNTKLTLKGTLTANELSTPVTNETSSTVTSQAVFASSNVFTGDETTEKAIYPEDITDWEFYPSFPKNYGSEFLKPGSTVTVTYTFDDNFEYVGPAGTTTEPDKIEKNKLTWNITVPSYDEQEKNSNAYLDKKFNVRLKIKKGVPAFTVLKTSVNATAEFASSEFKSTSYDATIMVSWNQSEMPPSSHGSVFPIAHRGPLDGRGNYADKTSVPDPTVNQSAVLGFNIFVASSRANAVRIDPISLDIQYKLDPHLILRNFKTGKNYYRPNSGVDFGIPGQSQPTFDFQVKYVGDKTFQTLKTGLSSEQTYTAKDLGIDPNKTIYMINYHFTHIPAGIYMPTFAMQTTVKPGYYGQVKNYIWYHLVGYDANGLKGDWTFDENGGYDNLKNTWIDYNDEYKIYTAPQTAEVVKSPEGEGVISDANVSLENNNAGMIGVGGNTVKIDVINAKNSLQNVTTPVTAYIILPEGAKYQGDQSNVQVVDDNYQGTGQQLLKIAISNGIVTNSDLSFEVPIYISKTEAINVPIKIFVDLGMNNFTIPENSLTTQTFDDGSITGTAGRKLMYFEAQYLLGNDTGVFTDQFTKGINDTDYKKLASTMSSKEVNYKLDFKAMKDEEISKMILVDSLPSVGDFDLTTNTPRNSKYNISLAKAISLPDDLKDKFDIFYSTVANPTVAGDLDRNTDYPKNAEKLANNKGAQTPNWMTEDKVTDFTKIHSFKLQLKPGVNLPINKTYSIVVNGLTPKVAANDPLVLNTTKLEDRVANNSFAVAINDSQAVEPDKVGVTMTPFVGVAKTNVTKSVKDITSGDINNVRVGDKLSYTINAANLDQDNAWQNVTITDKIPKGLTDPVNVKLDGKDVKFSFENGTLSLNIGDLTGIQDKNLTFETTVTKDAVGNAIDNIAVGSGMSTATGNVVTNSGNNQININNDKVIPKVSKQVTDLTSNDTHNVTVGDKLKYTIIMENQGKGSNWENINLTDKLPEGLKNLTNVKLNGEAVKYSLTDGVLNLGATDLGPGSSHEVTFEVEVAEDAVGKTIDNIAEAAGKDSNTGSMVSDQGNNELNIDYGKVKPKVTKQVADLTSNDSQKVTVGDKLKYSIDIANEGISSTWSNVQLTDKIPNGLKNLTNVKMDGKPVSYEYVNGTLKVAIGNIGSGESHKISFEVIVNKDAVGKVIDNVAIVAGSENETNSNISASDDVAIKGTDQTDKPTNPNKPTSPDEPVAPNKPTDTINSGDNVKSQESNKNNERNQSLPNTGDTMLLIFLPVLLISLVIIGKVKR